MKNVLKNNFWYYLILIFLPIVFFADLFWPEPKVFFPADFLVSDLIHVNFSLKYYLNQSLSNNQLPFVSSLIANGFPLLAESQIGALSIFNIVLYKLFPFVTAFNLTYLLGFVFMNIGLYELLKTIVNDKKIALFGSVTWMFSGAVINQTVHQVILQAIIVLPWIILFFLKAIENKSYRYIAFAAFLSSQQFLFGQFYINLGTQLFVLILSSVYVYKSKKGFKSTIKAYVVYIVIFSLVVLPQLIQSLLYTINSNRFLQSSISFGNGSFEFPYLLTFFTPFPFGDFKNGSFFKSQLWLNTNTVPWENSLFLGYVIPAIVFYIVYKIIFYKKTIKTNFYLIFTTISLIFSAFLMFGEYSPLRLFLSLPIINMFRFSSRFSIFTSFFLLTTVLIVLKQIKINKSLILLLTIIQMFFGFFHFYNYFPKIKPQLILNPPKTASASNAQTFYEFGTAQKWLNTFRNSGYNAVSKYLTLNQGLYPYLNLLYDKRSCNLFKFSNFNPEKYANYIAILDRQLAQDKRNKRVSIKAQNMLRLLGCDLLITPFEFNNLTLDFKNSAYHIYKLHKPLPLFSMYYSAQNFVSDAYFRNMLSINTDIDFSHTLFGLEIPNTDNTRINTDNISKVKVLQLKNDVAVFNVRTDKSGYFFFRQLYFPGWQVYVNGKQQQLIKANNLYYSLKLPRGSHEILFTYQPPYWSFSVFFSIIGYLTILLILVYPQFFANIDNLIYPDNKPHKD